MLRDLLLLVFCIWAAAKLRRREWPAGQGPGPWEVAKQSLRWGTLAVTVPVLAWLGLVRFCRGEGLPSVFAVVACVGLAGLVLLGAREVTGNVLADSLLLGAGVVAGCLVVANGVPEAWSRLDGATMPRWFLACLAASVVARGVIWVKEGR